jgi:hypothetical protein
VTDDHLGAMPESGTIKKMADHNISHAALLLFPLNKVTSHIFISSLNVTQNVK